MMAAGAARGPAAGRVTMRLAAAFAGLLLLSACSEVQLASHATKEATGELYTTTEMAGIGGRQKIGRPYQVAGIWYHPKADPTYDETGIASWYGPGFHGRDTANGEVFDQHKISAAHTTLPLPSLVQVTNLDNGRSLVVRVNDRGPFAHGRIIDMSRRGAQLLGFEQQGTAKVRVRALRDDEVGEIQVAQAGVGLTPPELQSPITSSPRGKVTAEVLAPPPDNATSAAAVASVKSAPQGPQRAPAQLIADVDLEKTLAVGPAQPDAAIFVQAGAFTNRENADRLSAKLAGLAAAAVSPTQVEGVEFYRVRLGPIPDVATADRLLDQLEKLGHSGARIVVN
ncbi:septal ring lytic transglycosylase RlpA family protein [Marinibaculum pumilum]|uniref:Endolytic peptidoglycan transglycosylase RlpA n=1 Tax=Marinibaculum pumilum TaxID=1766165 RepID=A0ABV7KUI9_9PROT